MMLILSELSKQNVNLYNFKSATKYKTYFMLSAVFTLYHDRNIHEISYSVQKFEPWYQKRA